MKLNTKLLLAARQGILDDPDFDMATWDHCLAGHICKAAGVPVLKTGAPYAFYGYAAIVNHEAVSVSTTAAELVGDPNIVFLFGYRPSAPKDKDHVVNRLDRYIAITDKSKTKDLIQASVNASVNACIDASISARAEVYQEVGELVGA